jgi:uncharacterized membrane protein YdjX (TVP38/TMEM64 family)
MLEKTAFDALTISHSFGRWDVLPQAPEKRCGVQFAIGDRSSEYLPVALREARQNVKGATMKKHFKKNIDCEHYALSNEKGAAKGILLLIIAVVLVVALCFLPVKQYLIGVLEWTQSLGAWGPVFVAAFYVVACVLFLPGSVLTLGAGFLFGVPVGFLTVWIGANLGAWGAFLVGRTVAREWVGRKVAGNLKFAAIDEAVGREGFKIVLLVRLSPVFPFNLLNYALGLTKVSFRNYALASLIGMLPGTLMYVYFGSAARSLADVAAGKVEGGMAGQVFFWVGLAATIAVALFVTRIARKSLKDTEASVQVNERSAEGAPLPVFSENADVLPLDRFNDELVANVRPRDWVNPEPVERYNLVVGLSRFAAARSRQPRA